VQDVGDPRAFGSDDDEHALQAATHVVTGHLCSMVFRKDDDAMSAAPPTSSAAITQTSTTVVGWPRLELGWANQTAIPKPSMAKPHTTMAITTARPCRSTRVTQPEKTPPRTAPAGMAANSSAKVRPLRPDRRTVRARSAGTAPEASRRSSR